MSELAFNANGENFDIPAVVTGWRVRRLKPRGAPELVYGRDGRPLTIPIESEMTDLREAVSGALGRYRLDPINDDGKAVEGTPAAYIQVVKTEQPMESQPNTVVRYEDDVVREAMRLNTELAKSIVDRFPEMLRASAELLRAADGAGIPARHPIVRDSEPDEVTPATGGFDLNTLVAQVVPVLMASLSNGKLTFPDLASALDWRKATPVLDAPRQRSTNANPAVIPPIDSATMAHMVAVHAVLTPSEAALASEVAKELKPAELRVWFDELKKLSVSEAAEKIRGLIASRRD